MIPVITQASSTSNSESDGPHVFQKWIPDYEHLRIKYGGHEKIARVIDRLSGKDTPVGHTVAALQQNSPERLQSLAVDLRSFGNMRSKEACIQAAGVLSLITTGELFERDIQNNYLKGYIARLPRDIEKEKNGTGWYIHFKMRDIGFFNNSKTSLYETHREVTSRSMYVSADCHRLVIQKYPLFVSDRRWREDIRFLKRQERIFQTLKAANIPYLQPVLQFNQSRTGTHTTQPSLILGPASLERISAETLNSLQLTTKQRWMLFREALVAVDAMHREGFVHGNLGHGLFVIKLTNGNGDVVYEPRIDEYGGSTQSLDGTPRKPYTGMRLYYPPERPSSKQTTLIRYRPRRKPVTLTLDQWKKGDIWAMGCQGLLRFADVKPTRSKMTGKRHKLVKGSKEIQWKHVRWDVEKTPKGIQDILKMMLNPDPNQRYTAAQAIEAIDNALVTMT